MIAMSKSTRNRNKRRGKFYRRLNAGTDRRAREHQRRLRLWRVTGERRTAAQAAP
jgi:hypothetical protein